jgi:hypothetical protein
MSCPLRVLLLLLSLSLPGLAAQAPSPSPGSSAKRVVRVAVALLNNQSRRMVSPKWEQQQLLRELKSLRSERGSAVEIEALPLESKKQNDELVEASKKDCDYVVITTVDEPRQPGIVSLGSSGIQGGPQIIGNVDPGQLAIHFTLLQPGSLRVVAEGFATAPDDDTSSDTAAADDAMRSLARQVARELRKNENRPPQIE